MSILHNDYWLVKLNVQVRLSPHYCRGFRSEPLFSSSWIVAEIFCRKSTAKSTGKICNKSCGFCCGFLLWKMSARLPRCAQGSSRDVIYRQLSLELPVIEEGTSFLSSSWAGCNCWQTLHTRGHCQQSRHFRGEEGWSAFPRVISNDVTVQITSLALLLGRPIGVLLLWSADTAHSHPIPIWCVGGCQRYTGNISHCMPYSTPDLYV